MLEQFLSFEKSEVEELAKKALMKYGMENITESRNLLIQLFRTVKNDVSKLKSVKDFSILGKAFSLMITEEISDDIDNQQLMATLGYFYLSKALKENLNEQNLLSLRLIILNSAHTPFSYTVTSALNLNSGGIFRMNMLGYQGRDAIYKMEISDYSTIDNNVLNAPYFSERKEELEDLLTKDFFSPEKSKDEIISSGQENHKKILNYLEHRILIEEDIDF